MHGPSASYSNRQSLDNQSTYRGHAPQTHPDTISKNSSCQPGSRNWHMYIYHLFVCFVFLVFKLLILFTTSKLRSSPWGGPGRFSGCWTGRQVNRKTPPSAVTIYSIRRFLYAIFHATLHDCLSVSKVSKLSSRKIGARANTKSHLGNPPRKYKRVWQRSFCARDFQLYYDSIM